MTERTREERFWARVEVGHPLGCWEWVGALTDKGYGVTKWGGRHRPTHRVAYELLKGPIPDGLHIDHLCRVRHCVNPDHLEPVPLVENVLRGAGAPAVNARKTHCIRGHAFTPENTFHTRRGGRECRICRAAAHILRAGNPPESPVPTTET